MDAQRPEALEKAVKALGLTERMDAIRERAEQAALSLEGGDFG